MLGVVGRAAGEVLTCSVHHDFESSIYSKTHKVESKVCRVVHTEISKVTARTKPHVNWARIDEAG